MSFIQSRSLPGLWPSCLIVIFILTSLLPISSSSQNSTSSASLRGTAKIDGTFVVSGVMVVVIPSQSDGSPGRPRPAWVGSDGQYRIEDLNPGTYSLKVAGKPIRAKTLRDVKVVAGHSNIQDIKLERAGQPVKIRSKVLNPQGKPLKKARVAIYSAELPASVCEECMLAEFSSNDYGEAEYSELAGQQAYSVRVAVYDESNNRELKLIAPNVVSIERETQVQVELQLRDGAEPSVTATLIRDTRFVPGRLKSSPLASVPDTRQTDAENALRDGRQLVRRGQAEKALIQFRNALNLYTALNNQNRMAVVHHELGDLYLRQGQNEVALQNYQNAFSGFLAVAASNEAGNSAAEMGDRAYNVNAILAKIGDVNLQLGNIAESRDAYARMWVQEPRSESRAGRRFGGFGAIAGGISSGRVGVVGPIEDMITRLEAERKLGEYRISLVYLNHESGLGRLAYAANDLEEARKHFANVLKASHNGFTGIGRVSEVQRFRALSRSSLADIALRQGKLKDASKFYNEATKGAREDKRLDLMWPAQRGLARTLWLEAVQEKDRAKAMALRESALIHYREALATIETLRPGSLWAEEARNTFLISIKDVFDEALNAYASTALLTGPQTGVSLRGKALEYAGEAFRINEQSRSRSLLDLLAETDASITEGIPAELLKRKQEILDRRKDISDILTGINVFPQDLTKGPTELNSELERLEVEFSEIENQIRITSPRYATLTANSPLSLAAVQQNVLDDNTLLVEYALQADQSYLFAISKTAFNLFKLPGQANVEKLAMDLRGQLVPGKLRRRIVSLNPGDTTGDLAMPENVAPFVAASNALYQVVLEPAAGLIKQKRLMVVAEGALNYIPFEVLLKSPQIGDFSTLEYLVKSNEVIYAPSASVVGAISKQRLKPGGEAMLIIADPVFNSYDARNRKTSGDSGGDPQVRGLGIQGALADVAGAPALGASPAGREGLPLARLRGTREEAEQLSKLAEASGVRADVWLDFDANEADFDKADLSKYRILHIATHSLLNAERPQFSGVVLSLVNNKTDDGFVRTDEVFNLRLGAPLVMLSACETGLTKERRGEGVVGLTRAFMYAGAPTVGVSLWSVPDKSTTELMTHFYKRLLRTDESTSPSSALRSAQLEMISDKRYSAPFYWAPFVLFGDWN